MTRVVQILGGLVGLAGPIWDLIQNSGLTELSAETAGIGGAIVGGAEVVKRQIRKRKQGAPKVDTSAFRK